MTSLTSALKPMVSCIMPTANRREHAKHALDCFLRQDYPDCELVIIDDGTDSIEDIVPRDDRVRYHREHDRHSIGWKRNLACELSRGDFIIHWDDDDWSASWRVRYQVEELQRHNLKISGLQTLYFHEPASDRAWLYRCPPMNVLCWVAGGTLCYTKRLWELHRFPDKNNGEDWHFIRKVTETEALAVLQNPRFYVASIHHLNTSHKYTDDPFFAPCPVQDVIRLMNEDGSEEASATEVRHA